MLKTVAIVVLAACVVGLLYLGVRWLLALTFRG